MEAPALDLSALRQALASLDDAISVTGAADAHAASDKIGRTLIAGLVQNFEFVFELSVKMLRRQLALESDRPGGIDELGFRDMLRSAAEKGLVDDVEAWFGYRLLRDITSHTYDPRKAERVCAAAAGLAAAAGAVLANLEARHG